MPKEFVTNGERFRDLHPSWDLCEWIDDSQLPRLKNADLYERAEEIIPHDYKRFRSDLLRLELLNEFGGVYLDTDVRPLRSWSTLLAGVECFAGYSPNRGPNDERLLTNAILGARPKHLLIQACIDRLPDAVERYADRPLAQMIGPWHLNRVYESTICPDVTIYDERIFYPQTPDETECAYAQHAWANSRSA